MNKPELKDFDYDGADMADWYKGYSEALENYTEHLLSTNKQLIDALVEIVRLESFIIHYMPHPEYEREAKALDALMEQLKTALRDAGVEEL